MKSPLLNKALILFFCFSIALGTSCEKISVDITARNALIGSWRAISTSPYKVTVEGEDAVQYLMDTFGYTEDEAQKIIDDILDDLGGMGIGVLSLYGDNAFYFATTSEGDPDGSWSVGADGKTLSLFMGSVENKLLILEQASSSVELQMPTVYMDVDFDGDGEKETTLEIVVSQKYFKNKGGMGQ